VKVFPCTRRGLFFWSGHVLLRVSFFLFLLLFHFLTLQANPVDTIANGCGCDITISPSPADGQAYLDGQVLGVKPGNKVCLTAAHFVSISLFHFYGTKSQPVTIINCGGQVTVSGYSAYGFVLHSSRYVNISGAGDSAFKYGILIDGSVANTSVGFAQDDQVSDISVDHMEVSKAGLGIACAPTPNCDPGSWSTNWKMYNMIFHDNYVHETFYEGFYIGNTQNYYTLSCNGSTVTVQPQQIDSVFFYNNILDKCGWTAAQISQVTGGVDVHDNLITNYGYLNKPEHDAGLIIGSITHGSLYRNKILNGTGSAFQYFGAGLTKVYNNVFAGAGYDGSLQGQNAVVMDDRPKPPGFPPLKVYLVNNTIYNPKRSGISFYNDFGTVDTGNIIANNIIAAPGFLAIQPLYAYFDLQANPHASLLNNLSSATPVLAGLVNAVNSNFHLLPGSPAIDSGINAATYGVTKDMDGNARPYGKAYDIGAYEYNGGVAPSLVANAGPNQTITLPVNSVTLDGSHSFDPNGTITSYSWSELSGPSVASINNNSVVSTPANGLVQGTYVFNLVVRDNQGATSTALDTVTVKPPKIPPTVNAGNPQTITLPVSTVSLQGTVTANNGASIQTTSWTQLSGPNTAVFGSSGLSPVVSGLIEGVYVFQLSATDNNGLSSSAAVTITVNPANIPPNVNAGSAQTITLPTNSTNLTGTASGNGGAVISSSSWTELSGPNSASISPAGLNASVSGLIEGTYTFRLTATDNHGLSGVSNVTIIVNASAKMPPTVDAGVAQTITLPVNTVTLAGTASGNGGASISTTTWIQTSGPNGSSIATSSSPVTNVSGLAAGIYVFQFTAVDNNGLSGVSTVTITVRAPNTPPTVDAGSSQTISLPANSVSLSGTASGNSGASISSVAWTETSGPGSAAFGSPSSLSTTASGLVAGIYSFELVATDNNGLSSFATVTVTVIPARTPPVVIAGPPQTINLPVYSFNLTGTASGSNGATISSSTWKQLSGPNSATLSSATSLVTSVTNLVAGIYSFLLTAVDNNGLSDSASVTITLIAADAPPNVSAGPGQTINLPASSVILTGAASGNNGATISSIQWKEVSGPNAAFISSDSSLTTNLTGLVLGFYVIQLTAIDNNGLSNLSTVFITVNPAPNLPPIANAGPDQTITLPADSARLDGTGSSDPDGSIASYSWTVLSGPGAITVVNSNMATATAENLQAGKYVFELTVVDNGGDSSKSQVTITVNPAAIAALLANAGHDTTITITADTAVLNGSASSDPSGAITSYHWVELSGPGLANILSANSPVSPVGNLLVGDYVFGLTVTNNQGMSSQASVKVHVVSNLRVTGEIKIYPNPAHGILNLRLIGDSVGSILVNIYDMNGRIVLASQLVKDQEYFYKSFDISGLITGIYILETVVGIDNRMSTSFIKF
jgi:hypothetical protein